MVKIYYTSFNCDGISRHSLRDKEKVYMKKLCEYSLAKSDFLYFSKSHSSGYVMLGCSNVTIGCDVEKIRYEWTLDDIKNRLSFYLNNDDMVLFSENPHKAAVLAWTRKESFFKVHQNRSIPAESNISSIDDTLILNDKKFVSIQEGNMILTCYVEKSQLVKWIKITI